MAGLVLAPGRAGAQAAADSSAATPRVEVVGGEPARLDSPAARGRKTVAEPGSKAAKAVTVRDDDDDDDDDEVELPKRRRGRDVREV
ncbi:MAG: hypothetical protein ABL977_08930, partial [Candidatus Eisenbacteria bacterium]